MNSARVSCAVRRCDLSGGERPSPSGRRSGPIGAEGSPSREVPGRVGAVLTKPGRVSTARWCGSGEHDRKEYVRNRCCKAPQRYTDSNLVDVGRERRIPRCVGAKGTFRAGETRLWRGCGEGLRRNRSEAAGAESDSSSTERITVNTGTVAGPPFPSATSVSGGAGRTVGRSARSGAELP